MSYALGVDLGTAYTAAATFRDGRAEIASLGNQSAAIPSVVLLKEDLSILTGDAANRRGVTEPERVAREFKRRVGDTTPIFLGGSPHSAEALMARLLRWVADEVAQRQGEPAAGLAVCHPANWGPYKLDLLAQAVRMANLGVATYLTEPEAAAIHYASKEQVTPGQIVAVYDLGGGTFDAAVLRKTVEGFEILGQPEGIERLGGIDFDAAVFRHVVRSLGNEFEALDENDPASLTAVSRVRQDCVGAKEALSSDTDVSIPVLLPTVQTEVRLTRREFETMIRPSLDDSIGALKRAIANANITDSDISTVLLVGGSSRIPLVSQLIRSELGRPVAVDAHPKHAIALGAALAAGTAVYGSSPGASAASTAAAVATTAAAATAAALLANQVPSPKSDSPVESRWPDPPPAPTPTPSAAPAAAAAIVPPPAPTPAGEAAAAAPAPATPEPLGPPPDVRSTPTAGPTPAAGPTPTAGPTPAAGPTPTAGPTPSAAAPTDSGPSANTNETLTTSPPPAFAPPSAAEFAHSSAHEGSSATYAPNGSGPGSSPPFDPPGSARSREPESAGRSRIPLLAAIGALLVAAVIGGVIVMSGGDDTAAGDTDPPTASSTTATTTSESTTTSSTAEPESPMPDPTEVSAAVAAVAEETFSPVTVDVSGRTVELTGRVFDDQARARIVDAASVEGADVVDDMVDQEPDEQCTEAIRSKQNWACMQDVTWDGELIRAFYRGSPEDGAALFSLNSLHLHIFGSNIEPESAGLPGPYSDGTGAWVVWDDASNFEGTLADIGSPGGVPDKLCTRIANGLHQLESLDSGNCWPIDTIEPAE